MIATRYLQRAADLGNAAGTCAFISAVPRPDCSGRFEGDWTPARLMREVGLSDADAELTAGLCAVFEQAAHDAFYGAIEDERRRAREAAEAARKEAFGRTYGHVDPGASR